MVEGDLEEQDELPIVALIGGNSGTIGDTLVDSLNGFERARNDEIRIDNKYYHNRIKLIRLNNIDDAVTWYTENSNRFIGAVIFVYGGGLAILDELKLLIVPWRADAQMMLCERLERGSHWSDQLNRFCVTEEFDLIELNPDNETKEELVELHEMYGISRILEVLESANWPNKVLKMSPIPKNSITCDNSCSDETGLDMQQFTEDDEDIMLETFEDPRAFFNESDYASSIFGADVIDHFKREMKLANSAETDIEMAKNNATVVLKMDEFGKFAGPSTATPKEVLQSKIKKQQSLKTRKKQKYTSEQITNESQKKSPQSSAPTAISHSLVNDPIVANDEFRGVSRSMINEVLDPKLVKEQGKELLDIATKLIEVREELGTMDFGPERQNLACDAMSDIIKKLGIDEHSSDGETCKDDT